MVDWLGSLVSAFMQVLLDRIARPELIEFFRRNHIDMPLLEKLKMLLLVAATLLSEAEEKQFIDPLVKEWFDGLQNAVYDADDLLDEIATKVNVPEDKMYSIFHTTKDQVKDFFASLNPLAEGLKSKLDRIFEMLKFMVENKDRLGLKEGGVAKSLSLASATTSLVDEHVFGRDHDSEKIINTLLSGDSSAKRVSVVAIVGMGGIGKTTLAQILYNDERVRNHFQLRSWASISETSDVCEITKKVFESLTLWYTNITDLNVLQIKLQDRLARQRFLLVLDGFSNENFIDWDILQRPFLSGGRGSKIIVTTRSQSVAMAIRADLIHSVSLLSHEDTWKLFASHAFRYGSLAEYPDLVEIGQKIVEKCKGLPLAAKTLGSLLHYKEDVEEWENLSNSKIWELPSHKSSILPALRLSYIYLPSLLKRCFAYCSIFPKSHEIEKWDLIYLWMADGILPQPETEKQMEDVGDECFQELLSRSFFHRSTLNKSHFMMHDLINDLAQYVAGDFCYHLVDSNPRKIKTWARHLSYLQEKYDGPVKFVSFTECQQLRTFLPFKSSKSGSTSTFTSMIQELLAKQNPLRVLSLSNYHIIKFPISIGNSLHLRYLNLAHTAIDCLPDFVCKCYNLETLILSCCHKLIKLPEDIVKLVNLRHLDISKSSVTEMPAKFGSLKSLQMLTSFVVSSVGGCNISELGELSKLRGALLIDNLQNLIDATEASSARLSGKKYLYELEFQWKTATHNVDGEAEVLDKLVPHQNVKRLKIHNFGGHKLPNWLGSAAFSRMVFLHLRECKSCLSLPSLGQLPYLKEIYVAKMEGLEKVDQDFYGDVIEPFKSLKIMKFEDMDNWKEWSTSRQDVTFPSLEELHVKRCPKLTGKLPDQLLSLDKLVITACQVLTDSMPWVPKLRVCELTGCDAFISLSQKMMEGNKCLETMTIRNCSKITICRNGLPNTLRSLQIYECRDLQLFDATGFMLESHCYYALKRLYLRSCCDSLISFPLSRFPNLEDLHVQDCRNLKKISSSPDSLLNLRKLKLEECSELGSFPEGGLHAPKLESLYIIKCAKLSPEDAWGLQEMASLTLLHISGLPSLISLEHTGASLKTLKIEDCGKLASLPLDELVHSLSRLTIRACPTLKPLCEEDAGEYWSLISRIPDREIDD